MRNVLFLFLICLGFLLGGCEKEELPVPPREPGGVLEGEANLMSDYRNQIFYDLSSNTIIKQNLKTDWDLGFESSAEGWHVILNSSTGGAVAKVEDKMFEEVMDDVNLEWAWDASSGDLDSTAFGDYRNHSFVYVVDRGVNYDGSVLGKWKIQIDEVNESFYSFRVAKLDGSNENQIILNKQSNTNFTAFSFKTQKVFDLEPPKYDWDIMFTQYIHLFHIPELTPYLVTGALINRSGVEVAIDSIKTFETILLLDVEHYTFSKNIDRIGFDWKVYDLTAGEYATLAYKNYIIKDHEGRYFKLHFTDFYDDNGVKGANRFEMQEL